ncbi:MAG TPA: diguanylate cyclase, partial [Ureibacillus sp.]|nr:diguanylate cyclase [Ureibacillus sp.]
LPDTGVEEAYKIAENLRHKVESTISPTGKPVTFSAGVAGFPRQAANTKELLELADRTLYEAKRLGRNCVLVARIDEIFISEE